MKQTAATWRSVWLLHIILSLTLIALIPISEGRASCAQSKRPNIVLIIADDMGYSDLGCFGGEIETPHLDQLAYQGLRLTNYYVNNMCYPTRASLLSGLYPKTALDPSDKGFRDSVTTLPTALKQAGYSTYMVGKWHLARMGNPNGPDVPHRRGFDRFYGTLEGASDFFAPVDLQLDGEDVTAQWRDNPEYYYTDAMSDYAIQFLEEHPRDRPFFLYVSYTAAHWPLHAKPDDIQHYQGRYQLGWDKLRIQRFNRMKQTGIIDESVQLSPRHPEVPSWDDVEHELWQQRRMEVYAAQVTCMDRNIGRIIEQLKSTDQFDHTLILFQHDNGGCHVEYGPDRTGSWTRQWTTDGSKTPVVAGNIPGVMPGPQSTFQSYGYGWANASNTPFRFFKQHDHEGGTRSPFIVSWPDTINSERSGGMESGFCHAIDIMPTLLDIAGVQFSQQQPLPFEGVSIASCIVDGLSIERRKKPVFWAHNKGRAVRDGHWKLVSVSKKDWELYDLKNDPTELNDLASKNPERVRHMAKMFSDWKSRTELK